ncbi:MAG: endonuclease MutS2 [Desulfobacterota bacterium]|nr:endonuclease MutS2 [Thermodesulfobacteriota bacterium]
MDHRSLKVLEYDTLLGFLKDLSISPLGQRRCLGLRPLTDPLLIESRLNEVMELKEILQTVGDLPLGGLKDIGDLLRRLDVEGTVLDVQEILSLSAMIALSKGLRKFFQRPEIRAPILREKVSGLASHKSLEREILHAVSPKGEILDRASPQLSALRHRLAEVRQRAKETLERLLRREDLQPIFQEDFITLRNGRYVLLVKVEFKGRLEGIIHDQSQSRMSVYFEPLQVVPFNNEISVLYAEEKEEEYRILSDLSRQIRADLPSLWADYEILGELDCLYAMARLSLLLNGTKPALNEEGRILLKEARNPLLSLRQVEKVVPVDLRMEGGVRTLIISGANAGGKTVALKTLGLLTLMVQTGLPIPVAEGSEAAVFREVFAVIGDEQSLTENLSSFSGHLLHVNAILEHSGPHSLVLLDELGGGTNSSEGAALAMGFLDLFREKGASVVVTTHFDGLKAYGFLHPDVENVSVRFDEKTMEPLYLLSYGTTGTSHALMVAERLGISEKVLRRARQHLVGGGEELTQALKGLEEARREAELQRHAWAKAKEEAERERKRFRELLQKIQEGREAILRRAEERVRKSVQMAEEELKNWLRSQKERPPSQVRPREIQKIKATFLTPFQKKRSRVGSSGFTTGERVRIESLGKEGVLVQVEEKANRAEVMTEKARWIIPLHDLARVSKTEPGGEGGGRETLRPFTPPFEKPPEEALTELNVIGLTIDEALPLVDKFIDQALLHGKEKVQIIHGIGSGRLRAAIQRYLNEHRGVRQVSPADLRHGGAGVTVVELR